MAPRLPRSLLAAARTSATLLPPTAIASSSSSSSSARLLPLRRSYASDDKPSVPPAPQPTSSQSDSVDDKDIGDFEPFSFPYHLPHQYSRVQRPNIIPGKVPRTTFDSSIPKDGRFTALNAHLSAKPLNVRQREAYDLDLLQPGEQPQVLSQRDLKAWWEARANGTLSNNPQTEEEVLASQRTFADELLEKRYKKISGIDKDGKILGQRIYLPNIVFRLIPNATEFIRPIQDRKGNRHSNTRNKPVAMAPYNPFIATFRVPTDLNKLDIKSYLKAVYNLDTTFVHTSVQYKTRFKARNGRGEWVNGSSKDNFKKAIVGLTKPFYYPNDPEGMAPKDREEYYQRLEQEFAVELYKGADLTMRRDAFDNMRNREGVSDKSARMYPTKAGKSLKKALPEAREAKDEIRARLVQAVRDSRSTTPVVSTLSHEEVEQEDDDSWKSRR